MTVSMDSPRRHRRSRRHAAADRAAIRTQVSEIWRRIPDLRVIHKVIATFHAMSLARRIRIVVLSALTVIFAWLLVSSFIASRADHSLPINLDFESIASSIESAADEETVADDQNADSAGVNTEQFASQAKQVLARNPLNAQALRILGQIAAATKDDAQATSFFQAAARRSLRESQAIYWLLQKSYEREDYAEATHYADALLRTRPQLIRQVIPLLAQMVENESANPQLLKLLAGNPPWRSSFLAALPAYIADSRKTLKLFISLNDTAEPPSLDDLRNFLSFLINNKLYEVAYYAWLQFLPPDQLTKIGFLINGSFEHVPSGLSFDWVIKSGSGVNVEITRKPGDRRRHALSVTFGYGRVDFSVSQLLMLPPGSYQLEGQLKGELKGRRGLAWRMTCAEDGKKIGQSAMFTGVVSEWTDFTVSFSVPDRECRAQTIQLVLDARSASERLVSGSVWYDELKLSRQPL